MAAAASAISSMKKGGTHELVLYQQVGMGTGAQANNPWLLELPDPITRATWDNYAMVSPNFIKEQYGIDLSDHNQSDKFESHPERQVVQIKANGMEITDSGNGCSRHARWRICHCRWVMADRVRIRKIQVIISDVQQWVPEKMYFLLP